MNETVAEETRPNKAPKKTRRERGSGCITQLANGRWAARIMIGRMPNGNPRYKTFTSDSESGAKKKLKAFMADFKGPQDSDYGIYTVQQYMTRWLTTVKVYELKPKSYDRLEQTMNKDIFPLYGFYRVNALRPAEIQTLINSYVEKGKSYSTIKKTYEALNACFKLGVQRGELTFNPCIGVRLPKATKFEKKNVPYYTAEELKKISAAALNKLPNGQYEYRLGAVYILLANTGLRLGEVVALHWNRDVDLEKRTISVHGDVVKVKDRSDDSIGGYTVIEQNTAKSAAGTNRKIKLNDSAYRAILMLKDVTGDYEYVLSTRYGDRSDPRDVDKTFRRILVRAGIPKEKHYGVHSLRHSFATMMLKNGVDIKVVSKLMGHSDISTTYNTYIHVLEEQEDEALGSLPNLF